MVEESRQRGGAGPDTPLFAPLAASSERTMTARQVKQAIDDYQMHLDQVFTVVDPWGGTIGARSVLQWLREGADSYQLTSFLAVERPKQHAAPVPRPAPKLPAATSSSRAAAAIATKPRARLPLRARLLSAFHRPLGWWMAGIYCLLGFASWIFIRNDPELAFWSLLISGVASIIWGAMMLLVSVMIVEMFTSPRSSDLWANFVMSVWGIGLLWLATSAYASSYSHLQANQFAPLAELVQQCMRDGVRRSGVRAGAVCRDGWTSPATGQGACSSHGGVAYWIYPEYQTRTLQVCRKRASDISWLYRYREAE